MTETLPTKQPPAEVNEDDDFDPKEFKRSLAAEESKVKPALKAPQAGADSPRKSVKFAHAAEIKSIPKHPQVNDTSSSQGEDDYDSEEEEYQSRQKRHSTADNTDSSEEDGDDLEDSKALKLFYKQKAN